MGLARGFDVFDYLLLGATLLISVIIGLYYAFNKGGQKTTKDFLLGGRKMPVIPTALSLLVSFQSGILILGVSSEMYMKGTTYFWYTIGVILGIPMAMFIYLPVFYNLKLVSAYEYLELRFKSRPVRLIGTTLFILNTLMYMAVVLYAPSVALSAVTGINLELLIVVSGLLCTFYTALGGLKAVVWTDAFQALVMYVGFFALIIQGLIYVGGPKKMWEIGKENGRIITDFSFTPFTYMNFYWVIIGTAFGWMSVYGTNQTSVQRYTSLSSLRKAQTSLFLVLPGIITMLPLVVVSGLVMYAFYARCDPVMLKVIKDRDQLLPYFTMDVLGHVRGLPGLFVSCLVSSTLSTVSSGLNSMAAVVWEDVLKPRFGKRWEEGAATKLNKCLACGFGIISVGLACLTQFLGGVFQAAITVVSAIGGPLSGLFLFGILFPWGNKQGALAGVTVSTLISVWICFGAQIVRPYPSSLPRTISGCGLETLQAAGIFNFNSSFPILGASNLTSGYNGTSESVLVQQLAAAANISLDSEIVHDLELTGVSYLYKLSYVTYGLMAVLLVFIVGIPVSLLTGKTKPSDLDSNLVWSLYSRWLPLKKMHFCLEPITEEAIRKESVIKKNVQRQRQD